MGVLRFISIPFIKMLFSVFNFSSKWPLFRLISKYRSRERFIKSFTFFFMSSDSKIGLLTTTSVLFSRIFIGNLLKKLLNKISNGRIKG